jgi:hypothetical protein
MFFQLNYLDVRGVWFVFSFNPGVALILVGLRLMEAMKPNVTRFRHRFESVNPEDYARRVLRLNRVLLKDSVVEPYDFVVIEADSGDIPVEVLRKPTRFDTNAGCLDPYLFETTSLEPGDRAYFTRISEPEVLDVVTFRAVGTEYPIMRTQGYPFEVAHSALDGKPVMQNPEVPVLHLFTDQGPVGFAAVETEPVDIGMVKRETMIHFEALDAEVRPWNRKHEVQDNDKPIRGVRHRVHRNELEAFDCQA